MTHHAEKNEPDELGGDEGGAADRVQFDPNSFVSEELSEVTQLVTPKEA